MDACQLVQPLTDLRSIPPDRLRAALAHPSNQGGAQKALQAALNGQSHRSTRKAANVAQKPASVAQVPVSLVLPLPPSVNSYWRSVPATRNRVARVLISERGRRFKRACRLAASAQCANPIEGDVSLRAVVYFKDRRRDLDNCLKPLLDALNGIVYRDDRQVAHLDFTKRLDPRNPRVELFASPWTP